MIIIANNWTGLLLTHIYTCALQCQYTPFNRKSAKGGGTSVLCMNMCNIFWQSVFSRKTESCMFFIKIIFI